MIKLMNSDEITQRIWDKTLNEMEDIDTLYTYLLERDINGVLFLIIGFLTLYAIYGLFRRASFRQKKLQNILLTACAFTCIPNLLFGIFIAMNDGGFGLLITSLIWIGLYAYLLSLYNGRLSTIYQYGRQQYIPLPFTSGDQRVPKSSYMHSVSNSSSAGTKQTKTCPYCGEEILSVAKKCKHCGEWLESEPKQPLKEYINCPVCGEQVEKGLVLCPHCSEPIGEKEIVRSSDSQLSHINQEEVIEEIDEPDKVKMMPCPVCSELIPSNSRICPECKEQICDFHTENMLKDGHCYRYDIDITNLPINDKVQKYGYLAAISETKIVEKDINKKVIDSSLRSVTIDGAYKSAPNAEYIDIEVKLFAKLAVPHYIGSYLFENIELKNIDNSTLYLYENMPHQFQEAMK